MGSKDFIHVGQVADTSYHIAPIISALTVFCGGPLQQQRQVEGGRRDPAQQL